MDTQITTDKRRWFVTLNFPGTNDDVHRLISTVSFITTDRNLQVKWVCCIDVSCCSLSRCAQTMILVYSCSEVYSFSVHEADARQTIRYWLQPDSPLTLFSLCSSYSHFRAIWCQGPELRQVREDKTLFVPETAYAAVLNNNSMWKRNATDPSLNHDLKVLRAILP